MTRDDILQMAHEAAFQQRLNTPREWWMLTENIERFAALVAAAEREACAKVCEDIPLPKNPPELTHLPTIERCAAAIRARGQ